jgi:four helix bundle suffix protein
LKEREGGAPGKAEERSGCVDVTAAVSTLVANAARSLLNLCCYLLGRQLAVQAQAFENEGGFTERLYRTRQQTRRNT